MRHNLNLGYHSFIALLMATIAIDMTKVEPIVMGIHFHNYSSLLH